MKVGKEFGRLEREDIKRVESVRKAVGDDVALYVDANNGYYPKQAIYMAKEFEHFQVGWFEEPVLADDVRGLAGSENVHKYTCGYGRKRVHQVRFPRANRGGRRRHRAARRGSRGRSHRVDEKSRTWPTLSTSL